MRATGCHGTSETYGGTRAASWLPRARRKRRGPAAHLIAIKDAPKFPLHFSPSSRLPLVPAFVLVAAVARPVARILRLVHLPEHFPTLFYAFLVFTALHLYISPFLSARIFPISYGKLRTHRAVHQWCD